VGIITTVAFTLELDMMSHPYSTSQLNVLHLYRESGRPSLSARSFGQEEMYVALLVLRSTRQNPGKVLGGHDG
jgi:hypothetical protein